MAMQDFCGQFEKETKAQITKKKPCRFNLSLVGEDFFKPFIFCSLVSVETILMRCKSFL